MKHGFVLIDKPAGCTSHDVVYTVRKQLSERKIGHLGTLDPAATGLLILAVGTKALKVVELFEKSDKEYMATIQFGAISSTYDREGVLQDVPLKVGQNPPTILDIEQAIGNNFVGDVSQIPPVHSAIHINGKRAYERARQGEDIIMPSRNVHIYSCIIESFAYPTLTLRVACSSGTYIRSLAHDLGQKLRLGSYLSDLRRTKLDRWSVDFAVPPELVAFSDVTPLKEILLNYPSVQLTDEQWLKIEQGQEIPKQVEPNTIAWHKQLPVAILRPITATTCRARKVF